MSDAHLGQKAWQKGKKFPQISGEKNCNWKGGITKLNHAIRSLLEYKKWVSHVFERDNWTCQTCHERGILLNAHHIIPFSKILINNKIKSIKDAEKCSTLWDINNGVTLCYDCHNLTKKGINT